MCDQVVYGCRRERERERVSVVVLCFEFQHPRDFVFAWIFERKALEKPSCVVVQTYAIPVASEWLQCARIHVDFLAVFSGMES